MGASVITGTRDISTMSLGWQRICKAFGLQLSIDSGDHLTSGGPSAFLPYNNIYFFLILISEDEVASRS